MKRGQAIPVHAKASVVALFPGKGNQPAISTNLKMVLPSSEKNHEMYNFFSVASLKEGLPFIFLVYLCSPFPCQALWQQKEEEAG